MRLKCSMGLLGCYKNYLELWGGDGENGERIEDDERNGESVSKWAGLKFRNKGENFDNLWTKLEEWKKKVIGGPKSQFNFCWI